MNTEYPTRTAFLLTFPGFFLGGAISLSYPYYRETTIWCNRCMTIKWMYLNDPWAPKQKKTYIKKWNMFFEVMFGTKIIVFFYIFYVSNLLSVEPGIPVTFFMEFCLTYNERLASTSTNVFVKTPPPGIDLFYQWYHGTYRLNAKYLAAPGLGKFRLLFGCGWLGWLGLVLEKRRFLGPPST